MQRRKVLVVEDDESIRAAVAYCLRKSGYTVLLSGDGLDALARIRKQEIGLVILDLSLPCLDGFGLLEHLRAEAELSAVAAIVLTAFEDEVNRRRSFELGAVRFITKPFSPRELVAAVGEVMGAPVAGKERKTPEKGPPGPKPGPAFAVGMGSVR